MNNSYCGRHQRNFQHDQLKQEGKTPCRFFFRGCDNILETSEASNAVTCVSCIESLRKKTEPCKHTGCTYKTDGSKYCKKHERDIYRDKEKEQGIRYCDIARGCFTLCEVGFAHCTSCLKLASTQENARRKERTILHSVINELCTTPKQICVNCGNDFEKTMTRYNRPSKLCSGCNTNQSNQDEKRKDRVRNYKEEKLKNIPSHYKEYVTNAFDRNYCMELSFEDFLLLVQKPCHYCDHYNEIEVNGIDRVNNSIGYTKENCVPCCSVCNRMKLMYHPVFFIEKCQILSKRKIVDPDYYATWKEYYIEPKLYKNYKGYKQQSEFQRGLQFTITKAQWDTLIVQPCYLCGYQCKYGIGLDRVDNTIRAYTIENVKPCCGSCNIMKHELQLEDFLKKAEAISTKWNDLSSMMAIPRGNNPRKEAVKKLQMVGTKERKAWKALGVYYTVLANSDTFYESQKEVLKLEEYTELKSLVMSTEKEHTIPVIQTLLVKLKKRRQRSKS